MTGRKRLIPGKSGMRLNYCKWRDRSVLFINNNGPSSIDTLLRDVRTGRGRRFSTAPTTRSAANILRFDKRFIPLGKEEVLGMGSRRYPVIIYDIDYSNEEVKKMLGDKK